ncbi:MAG: helix-turn-helix transcriptional regulator [Acidimicrobiales bacterium]|jgi:transcriptional regulator with XRE-family HTH domain
MDASTARAPVLLSLACYAERRPCLPASVQCAGIDGQPDGQSELCYNCVMAQSSYIPSPAAALLQLARIKSGLSQGQLSERAGVPATMISAYERDRRQPTIPTLMRLLKAAGFDLSMRLVPSDPHDEVLIRLDSRRSPRERRRRDQQIEAWRNAEPVGASDLSL